MKFMAGLSGMALYAPKPRVRLKTWCRWTGHPWSEVEKWVGESFRVRADHESVYTMAANAVMALIDRYQVAPSQVGFLALATEFAPTAPLEPSGALVVKGMVDEALERLGRPTLSSECEVPQLTGACLGGLYALKSGLRYVEAEGADRLAIVVASDIVAYDRGTAQEPTQGAGAVAMLVEQNPRLVEVDLTRAGQAALYRPAPSPAALTFSDGVPTSGASNEGEWTGLQLQTPAEIFGAAQTICGAVAALLDQRGDPNERYLEEVAAIVMHRPFEFMPPQALSMIALQRMAGSEAGRRRLRDLTTPVGADLDGVLAELSALADLSGGRSSIDELDPHPETSKILKPFRASPGFRQLVDEKMFLGRGLMRQLGNLGAASLAAWIGAALEEALVRQVRLAEQPMMAIGYGVGDAAEAWPMRVVKPWRESARKLRFEESLSDAVDLDHSRYESAIDGVPDLEPQGEFVDAGRPSYSYVA